MTEAPAPPPTPGRASHVISQVYYYVAAVVGFGLFLGGAIAALFGVRIMVLPREYETLKMGVQTLLHGLSFALPGLAVMWWHVREARRREDRPITTAFWGRSLYFHLVAFVSLIFVLIGGIGVLFNLAEAATADRYQDSILRSAVDMSIFVIVAGPVFWWHLRQGRRLTAPPPDAA